SAKPLTTAQISAAPATIHQNNVAISCAWLPAGDSADRGDSQARASELATTAGTGKSQLEALLSVRTALLHAGAADTSAAAHARTTAHAGTHGATGRGCLERAGRARRRAASAGRPHRCAGIHHRRT